jgi:hypothetical protein
MAMMPNLENVNPESPANLVDQGWYRGVIHQTEQIETEKGVTQLKLEFEIIDGKFDGRKVWERAQMAGGKQAGIEMGLRLLKQLTIATNKIGCSEDSEMWGIPVLARIGIERDKTGQFRDKNRIYEFAPVPGSDEDEAAKVYYESQGHAQPSTQSSAPAPASVSVATATPPPGNTSGTPPWRRR